MTEPKLHMPLTDQGLPFNITPEETACIAACARFLIVLTKQSGDFGAPGIPGSSAAHDAQVALQQAEAMQRAGLGFVGLTREGLRCMGVVVPTCEHTASTGSQEEFAMVTQPLGLNVALLPALADKFERLTATMRGGQQGGLEA